MSSFFGRACRAALILAAFLSPLQPTAADAWQVGKSPAAAKKPPATAAAVNSALANRHVLRRITASLAKPADFEFRDSSIENVAKTLQEKLGVPVGIDRKGLADAGFDVTGKGHLLSFRKADVTRRSALRIILREHSVKWIVKHESLWITSADAATAHVDTRIYDISERDRDGELIHDDESLLDMIQSVVAPQAWDNVGGPGAISTYHADGIDAIIISQTDDVHEGVARLLEDLRLARHANLQRSAAKPPMVGEPPVSQIANDTFTSDRIAAKRFFEALAKPADIELRDANLTAVAEKLEAATGLPVRLDLATLASGGVDPEQVLITLPGGMVSRRAVLEQALDDHDLGWLIRDETLWITTTDAQRFSFEARVYDIGDPKSRNAALDDAMLFDAIMSSIAPQSWESVGGVGSIKEYHVTDLDALVIAQTRDVHERIELLLADLRSARKDLPEGAARRPRRAKRNAESATVGDEKPAPLVADPKRDAVVRASNELAFDLYRQLSAGHEKNVFFSPQSIAHVLAMTKAGAAGKTADQIDAVLHWKDSDENLHAGFSSLRTALRGDQGSLGYELRAGNRLWTQRGFDVAADFGRNLQRSYGAELGLVDFAAQPAQATETINAWIEEQTAGKIKQAMDPAAIRPLTRFVATNAIYFKGAWSTPFDATSTAPLPFDGPKGTQNAMMMRQEEELPYVEVDDVQVLALPYGGHEMGSGAFMLLALPRKKSKRLADVEKDLSADVVAGWIKELGKSDVKVLLPKYSIQERVDLATPLAALGMKEAFANDKADFTRLNPAGGLFLDLAHHVALIEIDEKGTVAAAATLSGGGFGGVISRPKRTVFRADHPFLFMICDARTNAILFLGRMTTPPEAPAGR